jgi:hypothetical protein
MSLLASSSHFASAFVAYISYSFHANAHSKTTNAHKANTTASALIPFHTNYAGLPNQILTLHSLPATYTPVLPNPQAFAALPPFPLEARHQTEAILYSFCIRAISPINRNTIC